MQSSGSLPGEPRSSMRKALAGIIVRKGSGRVPGSWAATLPASSRPTDCDIARCSDCPLPIGCPRPSADIAARRASAAAIAACPAAKQVHVSQLCARRDCCFAPHSTEQEGDTANALGKLRSRFETRLLVSLHSRDGNLGHLYSGTVPLHAPVYVHSACKQNLSLTIQLWLLPSSMHPVSLRHSQRLPCCLLH